MNREDFMAQMTFGEAVFRLCYQSPEQVSIDEDSQLK